MYKDTIYIFADPFARADSGVSSYIDNAINLLSVTRLNTSVIRRQSNETLSSYRSRLAASVVEAKRKYTTVYVEAPESDAVTAEIPSNAAIIHIRLHLSRQLGALMQGLRICESSLALEQQEISRAQRISAPSVSAEAASRILFKLPQRVCYYPNPAPEWTQDVSECLSPEKYDVLFVGRFQYLKGAPCVIELAKFLPEVSFLLACPEPDQKKFANLPDNISFADTSSCSKQKIYKSAHLVIIPSIYETASMVGIEAVTAGTPIIAWEHLGIAEYAAPPVLTLVEPFNLPSFAKAIVSHLRNQTFTSNNLKLHVKINERYLEGFNATLDGEFGCFMPTRINQRVIDGLSETIIQPEELPQLSSHTSDTAWRRKLKKFRRDPVQFVKDTRLAHLFTKPGTAMILDDKQSSDVPKPIALALQKPKAKTIVKEFAYIRESGRIEFQKPPEKPKGFITALLYPEGRENYAKVVIEGLNKFDDFSSLRQPNLQVGKFATSLPSSVLALIERIDRANKENVSSVDNLVLIDPDPVLVSGLRCSGTRQRIIVILTEPDSIPSDPWHTDVLILVGTDHPLAKSEGWRRKMIVTEETHLPIAIRRAVQEGGPKDPNMMLPLIGFNEFHRDDFMSTDIRFYQGIINISSEIEHREKNMAELTAHIADTITDLAVTEAVYLRYRSLCDNIEDKQVRRQLLAFSLYDGVLYDVRT